MEVASRPTGTTFTDGQFRGRTLSFRLELAQEPTIGRKSGDKDRRPLANVPIVRLWISELSPTGVATKLDENLIDASSLYCSVDLCSPAPSVASPPAVGGPGPSSAASSSQAHQQTNQPQPLARNPFHPSQTYSSSSTAFRPASHPPPVQRRNHARVSSGPPRGGLATSTIHSSIASGSGSTSGSTSGSGSQMSGSKSSGRISSSSGRATTSQSSGDGGSHLDQWPQEQQRRPQPSGSRTVRNILGNLVSPAVHLNDLDDKLGLWFIYQDIAIRTEGVYSLRFSLFDVDSRTAHSVNHAPILAECLSSPLTIYAPRNHPGVPPSTKLAKHFVSQGYRLTIKKGGSSSSNSSSRRASGEEDSSTKPSTSSHKRRAKHQDPQSGSSEEQSEEVLPTGSEEDDEGIGTDE